jgi:hypothetical protein
MLSTTFALVFDPDVVAAPGFFHAVHPHIDDEGVFDACAWS